MPASLANKSRQCGQPMQGYDSERKSRLHLPSYHVKFHVSNLGSATLKKVEAFCGAAPFLATVKVKLGSGTPPFASEPLTGACTSRRMSKYWPARKSTLCTSQTDVRKASRHLQRDWNVLIRWEDTSKGGTSTKSLKGLSNGRRQQRRRRSEGKGCGREPHLSEMYAFSIHTLNIIGDQEEPSMGVIAAT